MKNFRSTLCFIFVMFLVPTIIFAEVSEEPADNNPTDNIKEAMAELNIGLKHMNKAQKILDVGDSAFAYNYRATSDDKAVHQYNKAIKQFEKALFLNPNMKEAHNNLGFCYRKLGDFESSIKSYTQALKLDPKFEQARVCLGETYLAMDSVILAEQQLDKLKETASPYTDTLVYSIKMYKLKKLSKQLKD